MATQTLETIRAKKIGLLIRDSREKTGNSVQDLGRMLGVSSGTITAFETGNQSPSLPQLETLAYSLGIPVDHFWGEKTLQTPEKEMLPDDKMRRYQILRNKIIGVKIRKARKIKGQEIPELANELGINEAHLTAYEFGEQNIPFPVLETLTDHLEIDLNELIDHQDVFGKQSANDEYIEEFQNLPEELQEFIAKPVNQPYLELAKKLSELSADRLRGIAEGILEITL